MPDVTLDQLIAALEEQRRVDGGKVPITVNDEVQEIVELWKPEPIPDVVRFKYYIHDTYEHGEKVAWISQQTGVPVDHPVWDNLFDPFYELGMDCELNTKTGEVKIVKVHE